MLVRGAFAGHDRHGGRSGRRLHDAGITLRTDLADVRVDGDPVRLRQIVTDQLANAVKFVPAHGTVIVRLRREDDWAVLVVEDTGPGSPADDLPHIFDRFFRSRSARADGSGIGLAVAAELTIALGGTLTAESEAGRGATFTTRLPALSDWPRAAPKCWRGPLDLQAEGPGTVSE